MSSRRNRAGETHGISSGSAASNVTLPSVSRGLQIRYDAPIATATKRSSITSTTSHGRRSDGSVENFSKPISVKMSGLPRSTTTGSQARLSYIASTRTLPTFAGKSPPLQALPFGSSTSSIPRLDISRPSWKPENEHHHGMRPASPLEYGEENTRYGSVQDGSTTYSSAQIPPRLIPELQALAASNIPISHPASSSISSISSPSTQFTTSSSPWSASTNTTTPISWSSASPNVFNRALTPSSKRSHTVPVPANTRTGLPKLPAVRETQRSVSSSKPIPKIDEDRPGRKLKKVIRESPEPTPPPRSSSLKSNRSRSNSATTSKSDIQVMPKPDVPPFPNPSAYVSALPSDKTTSDKSMPVVTEGHSRLQEALYSSGSTRASSRVKRTPELTQKSSDSRQLLEPLPVAQNRHRRFPSLSRRHARQPSSSEPETEKQSARSRLAKFSKRAIFGRKTESDNEDKSQKAEPRKGPTAGTGHEGYGKFVRRGRKQSIGSSVATTDSETSIASTSRKSVGRRQSRVSSFSRDQSDLDEFASTRAKPVVMVGGSQRGRSHPFPSLPNNLQFSNVSNTTISSTDSYAAQTRLVSPRRERFPPETEEVRPNLATRRSQKFSKEEASFPFPEPIDTNALAATPALDSRNTTQSSDLPTPASAMYKVDPGMLDKQRSKGRKLKWNIFRRKGSVSESEEIQPQRPPTRLGMSVNVAPAPATRQVPWYADLDSENEAANTIQIGQYLKDAQESPEREAELVSIGFPDDDVPDHPYPNRESILLPQAPSRKAVPSITYSPQVIPIPDENEESFSYAASSSTVTKKQPRLAQVGRIPKVVSTRQQDHTATTVASVLYNPSLAATNSIRNRPSHEQLPRIDTGPRADRVVQPDLNRGLLRTTGSRYPKEQSTNTEFLLMTESRNSDFTSSSESSGIISIMGPSYTNQPQFVSRKSQHLHDDEVWNEYNDFMDDIMSPSSQTLSLSKRRKTQTSLSNQNATPRPTKTQARPQGLAITAPPAVSVEAPMRSLGTPPIASSTVPSLAEMASSEEIRLRRSRIAAALHASYAPSSPFSMREFLDEYGRPVSGKFSERLSTSSAAPATPTLILPPLQRDRSQTRQYENAAHLEEIERAKNPTKHSDRQYASLMVSRWLSFGRVLFSPAHQEIELNTQRHVLVIDGLGCEDWSIYCAVTYQAQEAFVHDLKERRRSTGKGKVKSSQISDDTPPNHRRSEITSFNEKFPFPPAFFTAIVVRFPPAMPDSKLKNIISECRRTLAPGGFLELMVLDLDIVNMGVQTRRAIKDLKIKMTAADRTVSLKPIIDNVQTVLGSNGFANLNRCVVGVPVVGKPVGSRDSSSESRSSSGSTVQPWASARPYGNLGEEAAFSLNNLVADHSENADAKIGKMVSRTARSWWQHCFEAGLITERDTARSVLANKEILKECKARAANFKLLIAYTQKPSSTPIEQRRRTLSEPTIPTLATAGAMRPQR